MFAPDLSQASLVTDPEHLTQQVSKLPHTKTS
jgi:hypothetical protein